MLLGPIYLFPLSCTSSVQARLENKNRGRYKVRDWALGASGVGLRPIRWIAALFPQHAKSVLVISLLSELLRSSLEEPGHNLPTTVTTVTVSGIVCGSTFYIQFSFSSFISEFVRICIAQRCTATYIYAYIQGTGHGAFLKAVFHFLLPCMPSF